MKRYILLGFGLFWGAAVFAGVSKVSETAFEDLRNQMETSNNERLVQIALLRDQMIQREQMNAADEAKVQQLTAQINVIRELIKKIDEKDSPIKKGEIDGKKTSVQ